MWRHRRDSRQTAVECDHSVTRHASTAGLERIVCEDCGHVSVRFVSEFIFDDILVPDEQSGAGVK